MPHVERILKGLQVIVAGLACGTIAGLALHVVLADPALLAGATPAFADTGSFVQVEANQQPADGSETATAATATAGTTGPGTAGVVDNSVDADPTRRMPAYARERYYYASLHRRDPFQALVGGELEADGNVGLPDVADLKLVGIAWGDTDRFAMAEDSRGFGYVLRVGDKIRGGHVASIRQDAITFAQYTAGELSTITLELPLREDGR
ncbi:MAG: hypothetical protein PVF43_01515 [Candidatus Eiseniibacteriota bacterium]